MIISVYHLLKHFISNHFIKESRGEKQRYRRYVKIQLALFTFQQSFFFCKKCFLTSHSIRRDYRFLLWSPANLINTWDNPPLLPLQLYKIKFTLHRHSFYLNYPQIARNKFLMNRPNGNDPHTIGMFQK